MNFAINSWAEILCQTSWSDGLTISQVLQWKWNHCQPIALSGVSQIINSAKWVPQENFTAVALLLLWSYLARTHFASLIILDGKVGQKMCSVCRKTRCICVTWQEGLSFVRVPTLLQKLFCRNERESTPNCGCPAGPQSNTVVWNNWFSSNLFHRQPKTILTYDNQNLAELFWTNAEQKPLKRRWRDAYLAALWPKKPKRHARRSS